METTYRSCVIFSETYLPLIGGAEIYTYNLAKQLSLRNYKVTILTHANGSIPLEYQLQRVSIESIPKVRKYQIFQIFQLFFHMIYIMKRSDLIFVNYTYTLSTLAVLGKVFSKKPIFVIAHGLGTIIDKTHPKIYYLYRFVTLRLANKVITTSEEIAQIVRNFKKPVLIATGIDCSDIDDHINTSNVEKIKERFQGRKIILTVRRLVEKNGIQFLVEAIPFLRNIQKDFIYLIIGDGRLRKDLEKRVNELNISKYVEFLGSLPNLRVFDYIKAANVVVFPSSAEALSLAAIEVMHIETPLLVSNIGGLRELIGHNAERGSIIDLFGRTDSIYTAPDIHLLSDSVYQKFAYKLSEIFSETEEIKQKRILAKRYADHHFDWPHVINSILSFVNN